MTMAAAGHVVTVRPASSTFEHLFLLASALIVIGVSAVVARTYADREAVQSLLDWQVSAFSDLNPVDQAMFSDLAAAGSIIRVWYEDSYAMGEPHWATAEELADEYELSPFVRDVSWKQRGEVQWRLLRGYSIDGATAYLGTHGKVPGQSAYLLIISHIHKGASFTDQSIVWIHRDPMAKPPETLNVDSLVRQGWKQVVPYRGADEVRRLRGEG
jgi:hypothetical protein